MTTEAVSISSPSAIVDASAVEKEINITVGCNDGGESIDGVVVNRSLRANEDDGNVSSDAEIFPVDDSAASSETTGSVSRILTSGFLQHSPYENRPHFSRGSTISGMKSTNHKDNNNHSGECNNENTSQDVNRDMEVVGEDENQGRQAALDGPIDVKDLSKKSTDNETAIISGNFRFDSLRQSSNDTVSSILSDSTLSNTEQNMRLQRFFREAISGNAAESIASLFRSGAQQLIDVDELDSGGCTALAFAVKQQQPRLVEQLLAAGASIHCHDEQGIDIASLARASKNREIQNLIETCVANSPITPQHQGLDGALQSSSNRNESRSAKDTEHVMDAACFSATTSTTAPDLEGAASNVKSGIANDSSHIEDVSTFSTIERNNDVTDAATSQSKADFYDEHNVRNANIDSQLAEVEYLNRALAESSLGDLSTATDASRRLWNIFVFSVEDIEPMMNILFNRDTGATGGPFSRDAGGLPTTAPSPPTEINATRDSSPYIHSYTSSSVDNAVSKNLQASVVFFAIRYAALYGGSELLANFSESYFLNLEQTIEKNLLDMRALTESLLNCVLLFWYLQRDKQTQSLTLYCQKRLSDLIEDICISLIRDSERRMANSIGRCMLDYEQIEGADQPQYSDEWLIFKRNKKRDSTVMQSLSPRERAEPSPRQITTILSSTLFLLEDQNVHVLLVIQIMSQLLYWISSELFNEIIQNKMYLRRAKAMEIRFNVSVIEDWVLNNDRMRPAELIGVENSLEIPSLQSTSTRHLGPLVQLLQWLQCLSALPEAPDALESAISAFDLLNPAQTFAAVSKYRYERDEQPVSKKCKVLLKERIKSSVADKGDCGASSVLKSTVYTFPIQMPKLVDLETVYGRNVALAPNIPDEFIDRLEALRGIVVERRKLSSIINNDDFGVSYDGLDANTFM